MNIKSEMITKEKLQETYALCNDYICDVLNVPVQKVLESIAENLNDDNEKQLMGTNASLLLANINDCTATEQDYQDADELIENVCGYLGELLNDL